MDDREREREREKRGGREGRVSLTVECAVFMHSELGFQLRLLALATRGATFALC